MQAFNQTPLQFAVIPGRKDFPARSLTLILKGTFDLLPDGVVKAAAKQVFPTGDEFYPGDEDLKGSVRYESDFAFWKPRADLLLVGKCHLPGWKGVGSSRVTFRVGRNSKTLVAIGNRYWMRSLGLFSSVSAPAPFTEMELRYENSYGGEGYKTNPVGKGYGTNNTADGLKTHPLPNIEDPEHLIASRSARPDPAGFGPLGKMWHFRRSKLGTYKGKWLKQRWPWFPEDFDWSYYNAAPSDMQVDGYLKGDEELFFENLHPKHTLYRSQLPGLRVRCFLNEVMEGVKRMTIFHEVAMNMDTLWVDMEAEKLVLLWRGVAIVKSEEYEEIEHVLIVWEQVAEPPETREFYENLLKNQLAATEKKVSLQPEEPKGEVEANRVDEEMAKAEAEMRASLFAAGINPDKEPSPPSEETKAAEARILKELGIEDEKEAAPLTRELLKTRIARKESFAEEDLSGIDLSELDMQGIDFQKAILAGARLSKSDLSGADLTQVNLVGADCCEVKMGKAILKNSDLTGANLTGANLSGAILEGAVFEKAIMEHAVLDHIKAKDANFSEADLTNASLQNAELPSADFSKAILNRTIFRGANLRAASVAGATGVQINMDDTDLAEFRAAGGANFFRGSFRRAKGPQSIWSKSNLEDTDFSFSEMEGADFTAVSLQRAVLYGANMKLAKFRKADLRDAKSISMNLFQGSLEKANLTRADFSGSNLYGAEFLDSVLERTTFKSANLKMTKLASK